MFYHHSSISAINLMLILKFESEQEMLDKMDNMENWIEIIVE